MTASALVTVRVMLGTVHVRTQQAVQDWAVPDKCSISHFPYIFQTSGSNQVGIDAP